MKIGANYIVSAETITVKEVKSNIHVYEPRLQMVMEKSSIDFSSDNYLNTYCNYLKSFCELSNVSKIRKLRGVIDAGFIPIGIDTARYLFKDVIYFVVELMGIHNVPVYSLDALSPVDLTFDPLRHQINPSDKWVHRAHIKKLLGKEEELDITIDDLIKFFQHEYER